MATDLISRLLALWETPLSARADPHAAFAEVYTDPVTVNGTALSVAELVERARALQAAFPSRRTEVLQTVETPDTLVVAFVLHATHDGPLQTPLGTVPPTGRDVDMPTIDVLTLTDGRVSNIWVRSDELGMLRQLDAVALA